MHGVWSKDGRLQVSPLALALIELLDRLEAEGEAWPGWEEIASRLGVSSRQLRRVRRAHEIPETDKPEGADRTWMSGLAGNKAETQPDRTSVSGLGVTEAYDKNCQRTCMSGLGVNEAENRTPMSGLGVSEAVNNPPPPSPLASPLSPPPICVRTTRAREGETGNLFGEDWLSDFEAWWQEYPRRQQKDDARMTWRQLHMGNRLLPVLEMIVQLRAQIRAEGWSGDRFTPLPKNYLDRRQYLDPLTKDEQPRTPPPPRWGGMQHQPESSNGGGTAYPRVESEAGDRLLALVAEKWADLPAGVVGVTRDCPEELLLVAPSDRIAGILSEKIERLPPGKRPVRVVTGRLVG